ncbi:unnamed protein product, partial [Gulo gulo]
IQREGLGLSQREGLGLSQRQGQGLGQSLDQGFGPDRRVMEVLGQGEAWSHVALHLEWQGMRALIEYDRGEFQWGIGHPDSGH